MLSYLNFLVLIPIFAAKDDPFARYHANQGVILFIITIILNILSSVAENIFLGISPILAVAVAGIVGLVGIVVFVLIILGIINAAKGQMKPVPLVGGIKILK